MDISPAEDTEDDENPTDDQELTDFSSKIAKAQGFIKEIELKIDLLTEKKNQVLSAKGEEVSQEINHIVSEFDQIQNKMKSLTSELEASLSESRKKDPNDPENRIKENLFGAMIKKYQKVTIRFQSIESEISSINQKKIVRSAEIVLDKELNEEEKKDVINNPDRVKQYYEKKLVGTAHVKLQNAVSDIEERYKDLKKLETSMLQVHRMVIQLSKLVQAQGEMIENISQNISKAKDYIKEGEKNVGKSKKCMEHNRKVKCIVLWVVIAILIIIIVPLLIKFL